MIPVMNSLRLRAGLPVNQQPMPQPVLQPQPMPVSGGQPPMGTMPINPGEPAGNGLGAPPPMSPVSPVNSIRQRVMPGLPGAGLPGAMPSTMTAEPPPNLARPAQGMMQNALRARAFGRY